MPIDASIYNLANHPTVALMTPDQVQMQKLNLSNAMMQNQNMQNQATQNPMTSPVSPMAGLNQLSHLPPGAFGLGGGQQAQNMSPITNPGPAGSIPVGATNLGGAMPWLNASS